jgi:hypothetical protein
VGVSPLGDTVYVPSYNSGNSPSWEGVSVASFGGWGAISPIDGGSGSADRTANWLAEDEQNEPAGWNAYTGDICRYISENGFGPGGKWRMCTSAEFGDGFDYTHSWNGWVQLSPTRSDGKDVVADFFKVISTGTIFPASGYNEGSMGLLGFSGRYWSGSVNAAINPFVLAYQDYANYCNPGDWSYRTYGFSVRCVVQE